MITYTISDIKKLLATNSFTNEQLTNWRKDDRKGVQQLLRQYDKEQERIIQEKEQFESMRGYERSIWKNGFRYIAGIDEVGRGPLAGPVVAAAVILTPDFYLPGLTDSKQVSAKKREIFFQYIVDHAKSYGIGIINREEIDRINIYQATKQAMERAISQLAVKPDHLLIDAVTLDTNTPSTSIVKGDQKSVSIAAASIVAKVTRDRMMIEYDVQYPEYRFASNMGYGTKEHLEAIQAHGITPIHRRSFSPVQEYKEG
ncbi:ribonuclease HII [Radiobacillus kanasensis]|uniref:ribonuclease HII n=1 Tax=Radiobacillus kanasensis TaxID=2844358 RepID=UPI001E617E43|nr:ribonuclease HII [Radiobacillus kanasensis]UFU01010.1 ribonuclease HII [Radiobacillus kanasensis]